MLCYDLDIADVECRHAQTRDYCMNRGRGWVPSLQAIAARFACRFSNFWRYNSDQDPGDKDGKGKQKKRVKGGGAWRADVHWMCKGAQFTMQSIQDIARKYRLLSPQERERFTLAGQAATAAHRSGHPAFGQARPALQAGTRAAAPLPGTSLPGNVLVAADTEAPSALALLRNDMTPWGGPAFEAAYRQMKSAMRDRDLVEKETEHRIEQRLLERRARISNATLVSQAGRSGPLGHLITTAQFESESVADPAVAAFQWKPDIRFAVQAHGAGLSQLQGLRPCDFKAKAKAFSR